MLFFQVVYGQNRSNERDLFSQTEATDIAALFRFSELFAIQCLKLSADRGSPSAQYSLGIYYIEGRIVVRDPQKAFYCLRSSAVQGHCDSLFVLSILSLEDTSTDKNILDAVENLKLCAERGHIKAAIWLAGWYDQGSNIKWANKFVAFNYYKKAADGADSEGQLKVAMCYADGNGVEQNQTDAFRYFIMCAKQYNADSQFWLGGFYSMKGDKKSKKWAFKFFKMAADNGHYGAQSRVGYCFKRGLGVRKNMVEAGNYYRMASEGQGMDECGELALIIDSLFGHSVRVKNRVLQVWHFST